MKWTANTKGFTVSTYGCTTEKSQNNISPDTIEVLRLISIGTALIRVYLYHQQVRHSTTFLSLRHTRVDNKLYVSHKYKSSHIDSEQYTMYI